MDLLKFYQLGKDGRCDIPNGSELSLEDLLDSEESRKVTEFPIRRGEIGSIKKLTDLKSSVGRKIFRCLFSAHGIDIEANIKEFERIHYDLRKKIIDTNKPMLSFIDRPEFFFGAYPYLLLAFSFKLGHPGFDSTNSIDALYGVLEQMYLHSDRNVETYFCAHRENKEVKKDSLRDVPNFKGLTRILNLIFGIFENLGESHRSSIQVQFKQAGGDAQGIQNIFPDIFFRHFKEGSIGEVLSTMDSHIAVMNEFFAKVDTHGGKYRISTSSLETEYREVENFLVDTFGKPLLSLDESDIRGSEDGFIKIVNQHTRHEVQRIVSIHQGQSSGLDFDRLLSENCSKAKGPIESAKIVSVVRAYFQGFDPVRKALYETALYRNWGRRMSERPGSMAFGFERDHAEYQTEAFRVGFGSKNAPMIYGRHSNAQLVEGKLNNLALRQFWYY